MNTWILKARKVNFVLLIVVVLSAFFVSSSFGDDLILPAFKPASIEIVSGDNQFGTIGALLPDSLVVKVLNNSGQALPIIEVTFTIISGGGTLSKGTTKSTNKIITYTDTQGMANVKLTLGNTKVVNQVRASVLDVTPVVFTATVLNSKPKLATISDKEVNEGATLRFTVSASDLDPDDVLTLSANPLPTNATFDPSNGVFTFTPDYTQAGTYSVTFTANDGTDIDSENITITVRNVNRPPVLNPIGDHTIDEGSELTIVVSATDPDSDTLTYSISGMPTGATFNAVQRTFKWIPGYDIAPSGGKLDFQVTFIVKDPSGTSDSEKITITVNDVVPLLPEIRVLPLIGGQPSLDFGTVQLDETGDRIFQIHNDGINVLKLTNIAISLSQFPLMTYIKTTSELIDVIDPNVMQMLDEATIIAYLGAGAKFEPVKYSPTDPLMAIGFPDLNPGECLLIRAQFKPTSIELKTGNFVIRSNDPDNSVVFVSLQGRASQAPNIRVSPTSINFGAVDTFKSMEKPLHIYNDGNAILNITGITSDDPQFTVSQYADVNPHSELLLTVKFTPTSEGAKTATLRISSNDPDTPVILFNLQGNGVKVPGPDIDVSTTSIDFGEVELGKSLVKNFLLKNLGDVALQISDMASSNSQFTVTKVTNVPPETTMSIQARFLPTSEGPKAGLITITSNDPDESTVIISVQGKGIIFPSPNIRISPTTIDFGDLEIGKSLTKNFNIYNDGSAILHIQSITSNTNQFVAQNTSDIPPNGSIVVPVQFTPSSLGLKEGTITVKSDDSDEPSKTVAVKGNGISPPAPDINITPTSIDFGDVQVGKSLVTSFQIQNLGSRQLIIYGITSNSDQFVVIDNINVLNSGESVNVSVRFSPASSGLKTATVTVTSNDPDESLKTIILQGRGFEVPIPDIDIYPASIDFGAVEVGNSYSRDFNIYNRGNTSLQISSMTSNNSQFSVINTTSVPSGSSMTATVRFTPTSVGSKTAKITIVSNDPDEPSVTVSLYGDGIYPGFVDIGVWTPVQPSTFFSDLSDVFFADDNNGWVVGYNGTIVNTNNGGISWSLQSSNTSRSLNSVFFTDLNTGWSVGQYGTILKTGSGGYLWSQLSSTVTNTFRAIKFVAYNKGWAVGESGTVMVINDGFWSQQNSNTSFDLNDMSFVNTYQGWIVGNYGTILKTIDGGQIWTLQISGTTSALYGVKFVNSYEGWAVGSNGTILHTQDGGQTWVPQNSSANYATLTSVDFLSSTNGWVVGSDGIILHTINGGTTWVRMDSGTTQTLRAVQFRTPDAGWAVGANGAILKYTPDYPTNITSVTVSGSPARSGGVIRVTATGQARNNATFSISGVVSNIPMREDSPGIYVGNYTAVDGVNVKNATVTVTFVNSYGNTSTDTSQKATIDTIAVIDSAAVTPVTAKSGDTIIVTAYGEAGSAMRFTIETVITDAVMTESITIPGKYVGEYKVTQGNNVTSARVSVRMIDPFGNSASKDAGLVSIDTSAQIASVSVMGSPAKLGEPIIIIMIGDPKGIAKFTIGDIAINMPMTETQQSGVYTGSFTATKGTNVSNVAVTVQLTDALGNKATKDAGTVTIDTESRITSVTVSGSPGKAGGKIIVELVGESNGRAKFSIAGISGEINMTEQLANSGIYNGSYTIPNDVNVTDAVVTVTLVDAIGNVAATDTSKKVTIDNILPKINSTNVSGSPTRIGGKITVNMNGEPNSKARFNIAGMPEENMQEQPIGSGNYSGIYTVIISTTINDAVVTVTLLDSVGNYVTDTSKKVTIDNTTPIINSVKVTGSPGKTGDKITVTMVGEPNGNAKFSITGVISDQDMTEQPLGSGTYSGTYTILNGVNATDTSVTVTLSDQAGNTITDSTQKASIDTTVPRITSINVSGSPAKVKETVTITLVGEKGGTAQFSITGVAQNVAMDESKTNPGTYTGKYIVANDKGLSNAIVTVAIKDSAGNLTTDTSKKITIVPSWDVDRDGTTSVSDMIAIANLFGQQVSGKSDADVNGDGVVNILDLVILANHFGESLTPASPGKEGQINSENLSVLKNLYKSLEELQSNDPDVAVAKELLVRLIKSNTPQIAESQLLQNYPNPFNPETWIPFRLSKPGTVNVSIYSASGQLIRSVDLGYREMGDYSSRDKAIYWDGKNESGEKVSSGIYFYSIKMGDFTAIKKMIVKK
jgi:photosystem II stability/assembly factor-like uncharacterized protein